MLRNCAMKPITIAIQLLAQPLKAFNEMIKLIDRSRRYSSDERRVVLRGFGAYGRYRILSRLQYIAHIDFDCSYVVC